MASPGKGALKRFGPQTSSSSHGVTQPQNSSSNRDVSKVHKSSSKRHVPPLHKSSSICDIPPLHKSSNTHQVSQPQKSSAIRDIPKVYKSSHNRNIPSPYESSSSLGIPMENQGVDDDHQEDDQEIDSVQMEMGISDPPLEENFGSASYDCFGTSTTRKETRVLSETRKRRLNKGQLVFEVDECAGRIIGEDSQQFITKGGCLVRGHAKFDGTTWRNQSALLKEDIINKCMENSNYDRSCQPMVRAIYTQLASQHRNKQCRLHVYYRKFATKEDASRHPPNGILGTNWVNLCDKFASEEFQKRSAKNKKNRSMNEVPPAVGTVSIARIVDKQRRREGEQISAIEQYKIGHFSTKKNRMVNERADEILFFCIGFKTALVFEVALENLFEKAASYSGTYKGTAASTKHVLATENLRMELELEKNKSKALEEEVKMIKEEQLKFQEEQAKFQDEQAKFKEEQAKFQVEHKDMKDKMNFMMAQLSKLTATRHPS
ncbi:hypothetical protein OSB04_018004 [Centaurea solstitialis]|uniref:Uncharacterized protein n=1 Tax=Centaurea solstitialis TaxID=347529 RepID=A0AA38T5M5_9ASTR|nr:hypothetical protein OSB04_018004 [Centaurea solstitialis]